MRLASGAELTYADLVVCPGSQVDWDAIPGAQAAVSTRQRVDELPARAALDTWTMLSGLVAGTAVFAISDRHVPCAPVGLKPLFLAADHWRSRACSTRSRSS